MRLRRRKRRLAGWQVRLLPTGVVLFTVPATSWAEFQPAARLLQHHMMARLDGDDE